MKTAENHSFCQFKWGWLYSLQHSLQYMNQLASAVLYASCYKSYGWTRTKPVHVCTLLHLSQWEGNNRITTVYTNILVSFHKNWNSIWHIVFPIYVHAKERFTTTVYEFINMGILRHLGIITMLGKGFTYQKSGSSKAPCLTLGCELCVGFNLKWLIKRSYPARYIVLYK